VISFAITYDGIDRSIAEGIIRSIEQGSKCAFDYTNNRGERSHRTVSPIRLRTEKGKWYLLARDDASGQVRTFDFLKIRSFEVLSSTAAELSTAEIEDAATRSSVWASSDTEPYAVRLYVTPYARRYLDEVPLHRTQRLEELHTDGHAVYSCTITHPMEILPEIKNWIPHIHILTPDHLRKQLREDIESFLKEMEKMDI
jgi:predicted DNA-binding transcriptional regulator YafY